MQVIKGQSNNFSLVITGTSVMNATLRYLLHLSTDTHPPKKGNQIYTQTKGKWPKGKLRKVEEGFFSPQHWEVPCHKDTLYAVLCTFATAIPKLRNDLIWKLINQSWLCGRSLASKIRQRSKRGFEQIRQLVHKWRCNYIFIVKSLANLCLHNHFLWVL